MPLSTPPPPRLAADRLLPTDVISITPNGPHLEVLALATPVVLPQLLVVFTDALPLTLPQDAEVFLHRGLRVTRVQCLVCRRRQPYRFDLAEHGVPRACLCKDCDDRVTADVLAQLPGRRAAS